MAGIILISLYIIISILYSISRGRGTHSNDEFHKIVIAIFVFTLFLGYGIPLYTIPDYPVGATISKIRIEFFLILNLILIFSQKNIIPFTGKTLLKTSIFIGLIGVISAYNPLNASPISSIGTSLELLLLVLFLNRIATTIPLKTIVNGIFWGLSSITIVELGLSICYPVLGIDEVVYLFREADIRGDRPGAVGTFTHPNVLGTFMAYTLTFFFACYKTEYNKKNSLIFCLITLTILFLTQSRSSLLGGIAGCIAIEYISRVKTTSIINYKKIFTIIIPVIAGLVFLILLTPLKDLFFSENSSNMLFARLLHWQIGLEIFEKSPFIGVGLNAHIPHAAASPTTLALDEFLSQEFAENSPIHSSYIILLSELGMIFFSIIIILLFRTIFTSKKTIIQHNYNPFIQIIALFSTGIITSFLINGVADWSPLTLNSLCLLFTPLYIYYYYKNK